MKNVERVRTAVFGLILGLFLATLVFPDLRELLARVFSYFPR